MRSINKILIVIFIFCASVQLYSITDQEKDELEHKEHHLNEINAITGHFDSAANFLSNKFCNNCHLMNRVYEGWENSPHQETACIHCHTSGGQGYGWQVWTKGFNGTRELIRYKLALGFRSPHIKAYIKLATILDLWEELEEREIDIDEFYDEADETIVDFNSYVDKICKDLLGHGHLSHDDEKLCVIVQDYMKKSKISSYRNMIPTAGQATSIEELILIVEKFVDVFRDHIHKPKVLNETCTQCHKETHSYTRLDARSNNSFNIKYIDSNEDSVPTIEEQYTVVEHKIHKAQTGTYIKKYGKPKQTEQVRCQQCHARVVHDALTRNPIFDDTHDYAYKVRANKYKCYACHLELIDKGIAPLNPDFTKLQFEVSEPSSDAEKKEKLVKIVRSFLGYSIQALRKLDIDDLAPFKTRPNDIRRLSIYELEEIVMRANYTEEEVEMFTSEDEENVFREVTSMGFVKLPVCTTLCHPPLP